MTHHGWTGFSVLSERTHTCTETETERQSQAAQQVCAPLFALSPSRPPHRRSVFCAAWTEHAAVMEMPHTPAAQ